MVLQFVGEYVIAFLFKTLIQPDKGFLLFYIVVYIGLLAFTNR
jgi:hypothetical protein